MDINPIYMLSTLHDCILCIPVFITLNVMSIIAHFAVIYLIEAIRDIFILYT